MSREIAHKIMGLFWAFSGGIQGFFGVEVERGAFNHWGGPSGGFEATRANRFSSAPDSPSSLTTEGKHSRDSRGPDKGDRHSWGFERNDPGCIRALRAGRNLTNHSPRCFRIALMTSRSSMNLIIRMLPPHFGQVRGSTS